MPTRWYPRVMAERALVLIELDEHGLGRRWSFERACVIGRHPGCDLQLIDSRMSKRHARIARGQAGLRVEDLDSLNGVFVNGRRIEGDAELVPNDLLSIGSAAFLVDPDLEILPEPDGDWAVVLVDDGGTTPARTRRVEAAPTGAVTGLPPGLLTSSLAALAEQERPLEHIVEALGEHLAFDMAAILRVDAGRIAGPAAVAGGEGDVSLPRSVAAAVLEQEQAIQLDDLSGDTTFSRAGIETRPGQRSALAAPLSLTGSVRGVAVLLAQRAAGFDEADLTLLIQLAPLLAIGLAQTDRLTVLSQRIAGLSGARGGPPPILGDDPATAALRETIERVAPAPSAVLVQGESGTGKELVAAWLHELGPGPDQPFVALNCGAVPETLIESELFGHEKGAFSGADRRRPGKLELASGGTLFLDEIGDLPLSAQVKLLRALEQKDFYRVGGTKPIRVRFRLVCATHRDLEAMIKKGEFREDLFYRINVLKLEVPPLRERPGDVTPLAQAFLERCRAELGKHLEAIEPEALEALQRHPWPGNVRELRNVIERAAVLSEGARIGAESLPVELLAGSPTPTADAPSDLAHHVQTLERSLIVRAMRANRGKKAAAARALGISRPTLDKKLALYEIDWLNEE